MFQRSNHSTLLILIPILIISIWYGSYVVLSDTKKITTPLDSIETQKKYYSQKNILIHLNTNTLELRNGTTTLKILPLVSQGKPGSYYETVAGVYTSDYKEELHFSSLGHVYMPYSVHIIGNYFIHGIPYYPDGIKVSSTYSGGCIRLHDNDARSVYDFITSSTTIIITRGNDSDFIPTQATTTKISSRIMTQLMASIISLEYLTQDDMIFYDNETKIVERLELLPLLLTGKVQDVSLLYRDTMSDATFVKAMNKRAESLGLTNTTFTNVNEEAITTEEDYARFMNYIFMYKSYLDKMRS